MGIKYFVCMFLLTIFLAKRYLDVNKLAGKLKVPFKLSIFFIMALKPLIKSLKFK